MLAEILIRLRRPAPGPAPWSGPAARPSTAETFKALPGQTPAPSLAGRVAAAEAIWGEGFLGPGGEEEVLRLVRPFGLTPAASLLLLGAGAFGPSRAVVAAFGAWVSGFEADPALAALAAERSLRAGLKRRAPVAQWEAGASALRPGGFHHALALEALRGAAPDTLIPAVARAVRAGGHLALVELVVGEGRASGPLAARWRALERRSDMPPEERAITALLRAGGFEIRVVEDQSDRHAALALAGWQRAVAAMREARPGHARAAALVEEAEMWLLRLRLLRAGRLRLLRWHAIRGAGHDQGVGLT